MTWNARLTIGLVLVSCAVVAAIGWILWPSPPPAGSATELKPVTRIEKVETTKIVPKYVIVYREQAKIEAGLPASVQSDPDQWLTASGELNAEERKYTLSAVFDSGTGKSTIYAMPEPLPVIAVKPNLTIGVAYGFNEHGTQVALVHAEGNLIRIKQSSIGAIGFVTSHGNAFAGLNIEYKF